MPFKKRIPKCIAWTGPQWGREDHICTRPAKAGFAYCAQHAFVLARLAFRRKILAS